MDNERPTSARRLFSHANAILGLISSVITVAALWNSRSRAWIADQAELVFSTYAAQTSIATTLLALTLSVVIMILHRKNRVLQNQLGKLQKLADQRLEERAGEAQADTRLFDQLLEVLPSNGAIQFLRHFDFANTFENKELAQLRDYFYDWQGPDKEFLDSELEQKRKDLTMAIGAFIKAITINTSLLRSGRYGVAEMLQLDTPKGYELHKEEVEELNDNADGVCEAYDKFIRAARKRLANHYSGNKTV
jgi:hypothetical protein